MGLLIARMKYDPVTKEMVDWSPPARNEVNAPYVIQDTIKACIHPASCQWVDSRSRFNRITKSYGYADRTGAESVAPNKPVWRDVQPEDYERDVAISLEQLKAGTAPLTEQDRAVCKRIDEQLRNR